MGNPLYRGLGIVFGGRDLYGDTFSRPREFLVGDDPDLKLGTNYYLSELADEVDFETGEIKGALTVPVFWDHGRGVLGFKRLGKAIPTKITQEGIEYLIEIEKQRAQDYQQMIEELQNEGWLGLSSQTLSSFAAFDWGSGEIKGWLPAEMTLTVTPAEHRTRNDFEQVRSLFRKYKIEVDMLEKTVEDEQTVPAEEETLSDVVDTLLNDLDEQVEHEADVVLENETLSYVVRSMDQLSAQLVQLNTRLDEVSDQLSRMTTTEELSDLRDQLGQALQKMGAGIGEVLTKAVRSRAAELVQDSSEVELQALRGLATQDREDKTAPAPISRSMYKLPPHAPGQN
jgi:hypothetical protein